MRRIHAIARDDKQLAAAEAELGKGTCFGVPVTLPPIAAELLEPLHLFLDVEDGDYLELRHAIASEAGFPYVEDAALGPVKVSTLEGAALAVRSLEVVVSKGTPITVDTGKGTVAVEGDSADVATAIAFVGDGRGR